MHTVLPQSKGRILRNQHWYTMSIERHHFSPREKAFYCWQKDLAELMDQHMRLQQDLAQLLESVIEPLTGLPNRESFRQRLVAEYERARSLRLRLSVLAELMDQHMRLQQ